MSVSLYVCVCVLPGLAVNCMEDKIECSQKNNITGWNMLDADHSGCHLEYIHHVTSHEVM